MKSNGRNSDCKGEVTSRNTCVSNPYYALLSMDKRRCMAGTVEFIETKSCKMLLFKRFKCLFVVFLLLSASPTTFSHDQEYQFMNGNNQGALMCVPCCTITLVTMILLLSFIITHSYVAIQTLITTSGYMYRSLS